MLLPEYCSAMLGERRTKVVYGSTVEFVDSGCREIHV